MAKAKVEEELARAENLSIISLVESIIAHAYEARASDIHLDPIQGGLCVRLRIDGILYDTFSLPKTIRSEIISRIKVLSRLRIDEHQAAQDGRFRIEFKDGEPVDIRVSTIPTFHGENAVLRLLSEQAQDFTLDTLGLAAESVEKIRRAVRRPHGMILATGPTGSGKTTTLYSILKLLNTREVSIITIEDPIEYAIEGIDQIQANPKYGLTFSNGLRSILRQDPDIIMVGEIRDAETASIAVNTALTGHLVLSTLHTNDAATTLPRLLDMRIEPYLVASTVEIVIAQRLVRKLCQGCREERKLMEGEKKSLASIIAKQSAKKKSFSVYRGTGCDACNGSGFRGRIGIYEVMAVDSVIREAFLRRTSAEEIKRIAIERGMTSMLEDGLKKVGAGLTSLEEVLRATNE